MTTQRLTDVKIRQLKPLGKTYRVFDGGGLYLEITPTNGRYWRYKYRLRGVEKRLAIGVYPEVTLAEARDLHFEARRKVAAGVDVSADRKSTNSSGKHQAANTFAPIAREWLSKQTTWSFGHSKRVVAQLESEAIPWLGDKPIGDITAAELIKILQRIAERGHRESAHRLAYKFNQIFEYARFTRGINNPAQGLSKVLPSVKQKHHAAITHPEAVGALLRSIAGYKGSRITQLALKLAPLVFVRPGELRQAEWNEIDLSRAQWTIPAHKIKQRRDLIVPLSRQSLEILNEANRLTGDGQYVFPSTRSTARPMSDNTILSALRNLGYTNDQMTGHGFRALARTLLAEECGFPSEYIEHQLSHAVPDANGRAYNRTQFLSQRTEMMQSWADYIDELRDGDGPMDAWQRVSGRQRPRRAAKARRPFGDGRKEAANV